MNEKRRYQTVEQLYKSWAHKYDKEPNACIFLEEKITKPLFSKLKNKKILDLGCGTGRYAIPLAKRNKVTAIDVTKEMLEVAKQKAEKAKLEINFKHSKIEKFKSGKYDFIISFLVLDHIKDIKKVIKNISVISKKGTEVLITNTPTHLIYKRIRTDKKIKNQFYHPLEEYLEEFRKEGFELIDFKDIIFDQKYKRIKYKKFFKLINQPIEIYMRFKKK